LRLSFAHQNHHNKQNKNPKQQTATSRRQLLLSGGAALSAAALALAPRAALADDDAAAVVALPAAALPSAAAPIAGGKPAKAPRGFNPVLDQNDNYQFLYPFGWQEVSVQGADVVYKDVVEPLESVSVTLLPTDKSDISDFGDAATVADTMARNVLTAPGADVTVVASTERTDSKGRKYYEFEYTVKNSRYTRHSLAVACANGGTFYTLTTGANEKRWGKMKKSLQTMVRSFSLIN
jgi:photosystem II oxygen-evolving enhancer protein 2